MAWMVGLSVQVELSRVVNGFRNEPSGKLSDAGAVETRMILRTNSIR